MMKKFVWAIAAALAGIALFTAAGETQNFQEGEWTMTMVTVMEGMGQEYEDAMAEMANMAPEEKAMMQKMMGGMGVEMGANSRGMTTTVTKCLSADDPVPEMSEDEDCQTTHSVAGNTVTFEEICSNSRSTGQMTYSGGSMSGVIQSHETQNGQETDVTIEISGQYTGPCSQ